MGPLLATWIVSQLNIFDHVPGTIATIMAISKASQKEKLPGMHR